jgi:hypothetical protein
VIVSILGAKEPPREVFVGTDQGTHEVPGNRNRNLHSAHRLDKAARRRMEEIGWSRPRPKRGLFTFQAELDQSHADHLAVMAHPQDGAANVAVPILSGTLRLIGRRRPASPLTDRLAATNPDL